MNPGSFYGKNRQLLLALPCSDSEDSLDGSDEEDNEEPTSVLFDYSSGESSNNDSGTRADRDEESIDKSGILWEMFSGDKFRHTYLLRKVGLTHTHSLIYTLWSYSSIGYTL